MTEQIKKVPAEAGILEPAPLENPVLISDLHLTTKKPATIMGFFRFMKDVAPHYSELVILGDLFDFWIGDDAMAAAEPIIAQLKLYSSLGHRLLVMPGNRDVRLARSLRRASSAFIISGLLAFQRNPPMMVSDLFEDIKDGVMLIALLEVLSGQKLVRSSSLLNL